MADSSLMNARVKFFIAAAFVLMLFARTALRADENTEGILSRKKLMRKVEQRKEYVVGSSARLNMLHTAILNI